MPETETWPERRTRLRAETPDQRRARYIAEKNDNRDATGHFISRARTQDAAAPADPLSGVTLDENTEPWHHYVGHPDYEPHPDSVAAHQG